MQHPSEVIDGLDGRGGIVDRGRQRLDRDIDHDPDGERGILLDRPFDAERDHALQPPIEVGGRVVSDDPEYWLPGRDEVANSNTEHQHAVVAAGPPNEAADIDGLVS